MDRSGKAFRIVLSRFSREFGDRGLNELTPEEILSFLNRMTETTKQQTKHTRYTHLTAFFNFIRNHADEDFRNPSDTPIMKRLFRKRGLVRWNIIEKDMVDEIIFKTPESRNRLILELMARGGMRIGEVLKLTPNDVNDRKLTLREPKNGKEKQFVFVPQKVADRLKDYLKENSILPDTRIFPICCEAARAMVRKAGKIVGIHLKNPLWQLPPEAKYFLETLAEPK